MTEKRPTFGMSVGRTPIVIITSNLHCRDNRRMKTTLHLSKKLSRIRIMTYYWNLIVRRCEVGVCVFVFALSVLAATDGPEWLKKRYAALASKLNGTAFGAPVSSSRTIATA